VATAVADMAERWRAGGSAAVEEYLRSFPSLQSDPNAVLDLIYQEVLLRTERGENPQLGDYVRRFPSCAEALAAR